MKHIFERGKSKNSPTFLLLHGTGGNEKDLLGIGRMISEDAHLLGLRGNIIEHGMPRFFKRLAEGILDEEDLIFRTKELNQFLDESAEKYGFNRQNVIAVGYSNGANIAASLLFHYQNALRGAILFHPMVPLRGKTLPDLQETSIFIGAGKNDPLCSLDETEELNQMLSGAKADVCLFWGDQGHQLTRDEVMEAKSWYKEKFIL